MDGFYKNKEYALWWEILITETPATKVGFLNKRKPRDEAGFRRFK